MKDIPANLPTPQANSDQQANSHLGVLDELPVAYYELNAQGIITHANRAACALRQLRKEEIIGSDVWDCLVAPDQTACGRAAFLVLMASGEEPPVVQRALYSGTGEFRTYELHRSLKRDAEGRPIGIRMLCFDVTEAKREMEEARQAHRYLESVLAALPDVVVVTDALGFVRYVNPAAEELHGWKSEELIGTVIEERLQVLSVTTEDRGFLIPRVKLERRTQGIITAIDSAGRKARFEIISAPVVERETGSTTGVVSITRRLKAAGD